MSSNRAPPIEILSLMNGSIVSPSRLLHCESRRAGNARDWPSTIVYIWLNSSSINSPFYTRTNIVPAIQSGWCGSCRPVLALRRRGREPLQEARSIQESSLLNYTPLRIRTDPAAREFAAGFPGGPFLTPRGQECHGEEERQRSPQPRLLSRVCIHECMHVKSRLGDLE